MSLRIVAMGIRIDIFPRLAGACWFAAREAALRVKANAIFINVLLTAVDIDVVAAKRALRDNVGTPVVVECGRIDIVNVQSLDEGGRKQCQQGGVFLLLLEGRHIHAHLRHLHAIQIQIVFV